MCNRQISELIPKKSKIFENFLIANPQFLLAMIFVLMSGDSDVGDLKLMTIFEDWLLKFDVSGCC